MAWSFHCPDCNPNRASAGLRFIESITADSLPSCGCHAHMLPTDPEMLIPYWTERGRSYGDDLAMKRCINVPDDCLIVEYPAEVDCLPYAHRMAFDQGQAAGERDSEWGEPMCWEWAFYCPVCHPTKDLQHLANGWTADQFPHCGCGKQMLPVEESKVSDFWRELGRAFGQVEADYGAMGSLPHDLPPVGNPGRRAWDEGRQSVSANTNNNKPTEA